MIEFICTCGQKHRVKDEYAAKKGRCKNCGAPILVPAVKYNDENVSAKKQSEDFNDTLSSQKDVEAKHIAGEHSPQKQDLEQIGRGRLVAIPVLVIAVIAGFILYNSPLNPSRHPSRRVIEKALDAAIKGEDTSHLWSNPDTADFLFNVRSYTYLGRSEEGPVGNSANYRYQIWSKYQDGQPIKVWTFCVHLDTTKAYPGYPGEWKIVFVSKESYRTSY